MPLQRLATLPPSGPPELAAALEQHVRTLAVSIGERNTRCPAQLEAAARYIELCWTGLGLTPRRQTFQAGGVDCSNIEVLLPGDGAEVLLGAHYDTVIDCPGANDNGSGLAALLELTRLMLPYRGPRPLRLVAFVNEEPPYFETDLMGSEVYARAARLRGDEIYAMVCLETIGAYKAALGSQQYPPLFEFITPLPGPPQTRGNFIALVGNHESEWLVDEGFRAMAEASTFPIEAFATYASVTGVDWSDHAAFWRQGYPAIMLTDTAPYRFDEYHTPLDTPDVVNFPCLAELTRAIAHLAHALTSARPL